MESKQNSIVHNNSIYSFTGLININIDKKYNHLKEIYDGYYIELNYGKFQRYIYFEMKAFSNDLEKAKIECNKLFNKLKRIIK